MTTISCMDESAPKLFPILPIELLIPIFEFGCTISHKTALSISLVSHFARHIALPYVFSTIVLRAGFIPPGSISGILGGSRHGMSLMLPPRELGLFVRNLWVESVDMMSSPGEMGIFSACPNIEELAVSATSLRALYSSIKFVSGHVKSQETSSVSTAGSKIRSITLLEHTHRFEWHFLVGVEVQGGTAFLHNITHLRMVSMREAAYVPIEHLPNLTHIALPFLHLRSNPGTLSPRLPQGLTNMPRLEVIVLTVNEREWLYKPWRARGFPADPGVSRDPRSWYRKLVEATTAVDSRICTVLSPLIEEDACQEWTRAARGGERFWDLAARIKNSPFYAERLPVTYPQTQLRFAGT